MKPQKLLWRINSIFYADNDLLLYKNEKTAKARMP